MPTLTAAIITAAIAQHLNDINARLTALSLPAVTANDFDVKESTPGQSGNKRPIQVNINPAGYDSNDAWVTTLGITAITLRKSMGLSPTRIDTQSRPYKKDGDERVWQSIVVWPEEKALSATASAASAKVEANSQAIGDIRTQLTELGGMLKAYLAKAPAPGQVNGPPTEIPEASPQAQSPF